MEDIKLYFVNITFSYFYLWSNWSKTPTVCCASSQISSLCSLLFWSLWNAMGNSWGIYPSNINNVVQQAGFLFFCFFFFFLPLVLMVNVTQRNQTQKRNTEIGRKNGKKKEENVQYFCLKGQHLVTFSANRFLIPRSQGAETNPYSVCVTVFLFNIFPLLWCRLLK